MAGNDDAILKILIEMGLNDSAAQQAVDRIEQIKTSSKDLSTGVPEAWQSWEKYKNVLNSAEGATLGMREKVGILHLGLQQLGGSFPEIGMLARLLFNPLTAGFAAGALGLEAYFQWQKKVELKYHNMVDALQEVNQETDKVIKAGKSADEQFIDLNSTLADLRASAEGLGNEIKRDEDFGKNFDDVMKGMRDNQLAADQGGLAIAKDRIELMRSLGMISQGTVSQMEAQIAHQLKLLEIENKRAAISQQLADKQSLLNQVIHDIGGPVDAGRLTAAGKTKEASEAAAARNEAIIKDFPEQLKQLTEQLKAARHEANQHPLDADEAKRYRDLADDIQKQLDAKQALYQKALSDNATVEANKADAADQFKTLSEANAKIQALKDEITALNNQLGIANSGASSAASQENQEFTLESLDRLIKQYGGKNPEDIARGSAAGMNDVLTTLGFTPSQIENIISGLSDKTLQMSDVLQEIHNRIGDSLQPSDSQLTGIITAGVTAAPGSEAAAALDSLFEANQATWNNFLAIIKYHTDAHTSTAQEVEALKNFAKTISEQLNNAATHGRQ